MPGLNLGPLPIKALYIGSTALTAVYSGVNRVWPAGIVFADNFDRADTTSTGAGGAGLGSGWSGQGWAIQANQAAKTGGDDYITFQSDCGPDHWAECVVVAGPGIGKYCVLDARRPAGNVQTAYMVFVAPGEATMTIGRSIGGGYADLIKAGSVPVNTDGAKLRIECEGTTIRGFYNDVLTATATDSNLSGSTNRYVGLNATDGSIVDNYRCGPLPYTP
jgi:hypothetical protein